MKKVSLLFCAVAFLFVSPLASRAEDAEDGFQIDARIALNGYQTVVEQELEWSLICLRTLAATDEVSSGDWERIKGQLAKFAEGNPTYAAIWFARPDGSYFTVEKGATGQNIKDRAYFPGLMGGNEVAGDLVVSKSTGKKSIIVAVPVKTNGQIIGALGVSVSAEQLARFVDDKMRFPKDVVFYGLDAKGQTALHRETELMFAFPSEMGSPSLRSAVTTMLSKPEGVVRYSFRGKEKIAVFQTSKKIGWVFVVGAVVSDAPHSR